MSAVIEKHIICNKCGRAYGIDCRRWSIKKHRADAKKEGWIFRKGKDICLICRKKMIN